MTSALEEIALNPFLTRGSDHALHFDGVDLCRVAKEFGTPVWVSSVPIVRRNLGRLREATGRIFPNCRHAYALKANTTSSIVKALLELSCDLDVSSETELALARHLGVTGDRIILNGSCKSAELLKNAFAAGVTQLNIDRFDDLRLIGSLARSFGLMVRCLLRVRASAAPDLSSVSQDFSILNRDDGKFGFDAEGAGRAISEIGGISGLRLCGIHVHVGFAGYSGQVGPGDELRLRRHVVRDAIRCLVLYRQCFAGARPILNLGGGTRSAPLAVVKPEGGKRQTARLLDVVPIEQHVELVHEELLRSGLTPAAVEIQFENGGYLVDTSTLMLTEVLGELRRPDGERIVMLNASTRTFVTQARLTYPAIPVTDQGQHELATIVGNSCAPDNLVTGWPLPPLRAGSLIALLNQGAYCETESTQFNGINRPGVVVADSGLTLLLKRPERWEDHYLRDEGYRLTRSGPARHYDDLPDLHQEEQAW
jgi:diaminopimelate decarboxylase